jgi:hypothetical protein
MAFCRFRAVCVSALLLLPSVAQAEGPGKDEKAGAQKTFEAGTKLYDAHRYKEALTALRASYEILRSPNSRLMIARCLRELGRNREAYSEFQAVAAEAREKGDKYASAATAATEEGDEVKQRIGFVTVRVTGAQEGVTVTLGDQSVDAAAIGTPVPADPATLVVTAKGSDGSSARAEVTVAAGESQTVELNLVPPSSDEPAPPPPPPAEPAKVVVDTGGKGIPLRTWAYVAGGVGVLGVATFAVFGSMANSKYNELKEACPGGPCGPGHEDDISAGKTDQLIANIGLGAGIVGLGVGTVLFFMSGKSSTADEPTATNLRVNLGVRSVSVQGMF